MKKEITRIKQILKTLPEIRWRIKHYSPTIWSVVRERLYGQNDLWLHIKDLCEPLGLTDTSFREYPRLNDYLMSRKYWKERLSNLTNPE